MQWYSPSEPVGLIYWAPADIASGLGFGVALLCALEVGGAWRTAHLSATPAQLVSCLLMGPLPVIERWSFLHLHVVEQRFPVISVSWGTGLWLTTFVSGVILLLCPMAILWRLAARRSARKTLALSLFEHVP